MIKHVNKYEISAKTDDCKVYVGSSHGVNVRCMEDHVKPVIRE